MNKKIIIGIVVIIILASIGTYLALTPTYKEIEMSGYTFEVPGSNAEVKNNTINYNTYLDTENDLNIKTWACKDINDIDGTANASIDMGIQLGENMGTNTTYNNISLYNKSGTYTYYEVDTNNACIILITSKNLNTIEHILETMKKPELNINNPFKMTSTGLIISNTNSDTTSNTQVSTTKSSTKKSSTKTNTKKKSSSSDDEEWYDVVVPGSGGKTVKAKHDQLTPYGNRYITADGSPIYS